MFRSCLWFSQWFTFFLLHDFQTQRATVIEVSRAPGAVWLPWGRLDWNFGRLVWGEVLVQDGKSSHSLCRRRRRGSNKVRKIKLMDCRSFITSAEFFCGQWLSYKIAFFCFGTLQSLNSSVPTYCDGFSEDRSAGRSWQPKEPLPFWSFWSCLKKRMHEGRLLCDCSCHEKKSGRRSKTNSCRQETSPFLRLFQAKKDTGRVPR